MASINYSRLRKLHEAKGAKEAGRVLREQFQAGDIRPQDVDLGRLFAECYGWHNYWTCKTNPREYPATKVMQLAEAEGAVTSSMFTNVGGQFMYTTTMDAYEGEEGVFTALIPEARPSTLDGEKIPGVIEIGDEIAVRYETDPYALAAPSENWVFSPSILDRGMIVPITWEAIFNDKTGQLVERASDVGRWMKVRREKLAIDCVIDENTTTHRYNWRGTTIATYGDNSGNHTWDNLVASNALVDWTDVDAVKQAYNALRHPFTGEPITFRPRHLVAAMGLEQTVFRVLNATEIKVTTPGYATSGNPTQTTIRNPYLNMLQPVTSMLLADRLATDTDWFVGDISKYARCMVAEPMNVVQAPPNNKDEFERRIVQQYRVNERFAYVVVEPRAMVKSTA